MVQRLSAELAQHDATSAVGRGLLEHLEEERLREVVRAAGGEQKSAGREQTHRAQVDLLVAADRSRKCGPRLGECRWVEHDRLEPRVFALAGLQVLEGVGFDEGAVRESIAAEVLLRAGECVCRRIQRDDAVRSACEMERKGAVIAEAVERASACDAADERSVLALIQEGPGLLASPRCRQVSDTVFVRFDLVGHRSVEELDRGGKPFLHAERDVVAGEDAFGSEEFAQRHDDVRSKVLESGAHQLHDEPSVIPVDDERRDSVSFAVHESERVRFVLEAGSARDGALELAPPPRCIDGDVGVAFDQPERDLRARAPEGGAEPLTALIGDMDSPGVCIGPLQHVAAEDPRMAIGPTSSSLVGDDGGLHQRKLNGALVSCFDRG